MSVLPMTPLSAADLLHAAAAALLALGVVEAIKPIAPLSTPGLPRRYEIRESQASIPGARAEDTHQTQSAVTAPAKTSIV